MLCIFVGALPQHEEGSEREYVRPPKPLRVPVSADKALRTRVHELCRQAKLPKVSTRTILDDPEHSAIELSYHYKASIRKYYRLIHYLVARFLGAHLHLAVLPLQH